MNNPFEKETDGQNWISRQLREKLSSFTFDRLPHRLRKRLIAEAFVLYAEAAVGGSKTPRFTVNGNTVLIVLDNQQAGILLRGFFDKLWTINARFRPAIGQMRSVVTNHLGAGDTYDVDVELPEEAAKFPVGGMNRLRTQYVYYRTHSEK